MGTLNPTHSLTHSLMLQYVKPGAPCPTGFLLQNFKGWLSKTYSRPEVLCTAWPNIAKQWRRSCQLSVSNTMSSSDNEKPVQADSHDQSVQQISQCLPWTTSDDCRRVPGRGRPVSWRMIAVTLVQWLDASRSAADQSCKYANTQFISLLASLPTPCCEKPWQWFRVTIFLMPMTILRWPWLSK